MATDWQDEIRWNNAGLIPVIAQEYPIGDVLMLAWMNREALRLTLESGQAVYWSRSRQSLWRKGETSGHVQQVRDIRLDCDSDALLLKVEQQGGIACHTGRKSCFYKQFQAGQWQDVEPVLKEASDIYNGK